MTERRKPPGEGESFADSGSPALSEWHGERNSPLGPKDFFPSSGAKVWWICSFGHEWIESLNNRSKGRGCPYCSGRRCIASVNDLATLHSEIFTQIYDLTQVDCPLDEIHPGSTRVLTWRCDIGHLWEAEIRTRVKGHGCPFCAGVKVTRGVNDLASQRPDLLVEWHSSNPAPWEVAVKSNKKYTWVCQNKSSHIFDMTASDRCNSKHGSCPYCEGKRVLAGDNDLATTHPELSLEWDESNTLRSFEVSAGSQRKVKWRCAEGHIFTSSIAHRAKRGQGCPVCSNHKVVMGINDISTTHPELAAEVDISARVNEGWEGISAGSARHLAWRCVKNHRWVQRVVVRSRQKAGCPFCARQIVDTGITDFATLHPSLLEDWDYSTNQSLDPRKLFPNTDVQVGWVCRSGHKWSTSLVARVRKDSGCPFCAGRQAFPGINDVLSSDFGSSWDFEANGDIDPNWIHRGSPRSYFWRCEEGHSWKSKCATRNDGKGCPTCSPTTYSPSNPGILYFIQKDSQRAMKVGITNGIDSSKRLTAFTKANWEVLATWSSPEGWRIVELESRVLFWVRNVLGLPPHLGPSEMSNLGGWTETFSGDGVDPQQVISRINEEAELLLKLDVDN